MTGFWQDSFPTTGIETTSTPDMPEFYLNAIQQLIGKGAAIADMPVQPYTGQRIADFTAPQQQAFNLAQQGVGSWKPGLQQAQDLATQSSTYNPGALSQFMNPYQSAVVDEIGRLGNQNFTENILPAANAAFTGAGQFGSTRNQQAVNRAARDTQQNILGQQANALNTGFNTANQNYLNWAGQGQKGSQLLSDLSARGQGLNTADVGALSAVGGAQQNLGQQNLDYAYNQFQQQQQQPTQNLAMLNSIIRGLQLPTQTTTTNSGWTPQASTGQLLTGALTGMAGLFQ